MAVLGLLLLLSAAGLAADVVRRNTASIDVEALGQTFSLRSGWRFAAGAATGAIGRRCLTRAAWRHEMGSRDGRRPTENRSAADACSGP